MAVDSLTPRQRAGQLIIEKLGVAPRASGSVSASQVSTLLSASSTGRPSISDLEKHLDDHRKGKGYLSSKVAASLGSLDQKNSFRVSPKDLSSYLTYSTALSYEGRAYYVSSIDQTIDTINSLQDSTSKSSTPAISREQALSRYRSA